MLSSSNTTYTNWTLHEEHHLIRSNTKKKKIICCSYCKPEHWLNHAKSCLIFWWVCCATSQGQNIRNCSRYDTLLYTTNYSYNNTAMWRKMKSYSTIGRMPVRPPCIWCLDASLGTPPHQIKYNNNNNNKSFNTIMQIRWYFGLPNESTNLWAFHIMSLHWVNFCWKLGRKGTIMPSTCGQGKTANDALFTVYRMEKSVKH